MDAIVLFSHGSLLCGSGEALKAHAARLRAKGLAPIVEIGYLNYTEPLFAETVTRCVAKGASRILVAPYFLVPGYFVKVDLPKAVAQARCDHPDVQFVVGDAIGFDVSLADALIESAQRALPRAAWREDILRAAQFCTSNPQCPLYGMEGCRAAVQSVVSEPRSDESQGPQALLVMVHGSPRPIANADMFRVVEEISAREVFPIVEVGFMECNEPNIPDAIDACVTRGAGEIRAVPYFLHTGNHVAEDLPALLEAACERYPDVGFRMGAYLGRSERLTQILADRIRAVL